MQTHVPASTHSMMQFLQDWNRADVGEWITNIVGFPQYRATFERQVNGNRLMQLSANQLVSLGVRDHDHQITIMEALRKAQTAYAEQRSTGLSAQNTPRFEDLPPPKDEAEKMRRIRSRRLSFVDPTSLGARGGGSVEFIENDSHVEHADGHAADSGDSAAQQAADAEAHAVAKAHAIAKIEGLLAAEDPIDALIQCLRGIHAEDHESHILQSLLVEQARGCPGGRRGVSLGVTWTPPSPP